MAILSQILVEAGTGRWAFWRVRGESVIADKVCNETAAHFAGKFCQEVMKSPCRADVMTDGFTPERGPSMWTRQALEGYLDE